MFVRRHYPGPVSHKEGEGEEEGVGAGRKRTLEVLELVPLFSLSFFRLSFSYSPGKASALSGTVCAQTRPRPCATQREKRGGGGGGCWGGQEAHTRGTGVGLFFTPFFSRFFLLSGEGFSALWLFLCADTTPALCKHKEREGEEEGEGVGAGRKRTLEIWGLVSLDRVHGDDLIRVHGDDL